MASKLSEIDQVLIRYADTLSANAISFKIGGILTAEQVASRIAQLLDTPDRLTELQQDQLVTLKMRQLVVQFEEMTLTARTGEVMLRALELIGNRLDKRSESTQKDLSTLYAFQGTVLLDAVSIAMAHMRGAMTASSPQAEVEWDNALESAIRFAQIELSRHDADAPRPAVAVAAPLPLLATAETAETSSRTLPEAVLPVRRAKKG